MAEPFLSEIRIFSFNFPPKGWAQCNGQLLPINQNQALYSLLGTTYGGDGRVNFGLPDLRGRVPIHVDNNHPLGQKGGEAAHTITAPEMPQHTHPLQSTNTQAASPNVNGNVLAKANTNIYGAAANLGQMRTGTVSNVGGGQAHENRQPFLVLNVCIALQGLFPSRN